MSGRYTLKEVQVILKSGVRLVAEIDSIDGLKSLLNELASANLVVQAVNTETTVHTPGQADPVATPDDPLSRVETKASLSGSALSKAKIVAFKDNVPQLLRPNIFNNVTDALLVLLLCVEAGLQTSKISYESFKGLYEAQNIKSGTPMRILLSDLRKAGYLDKTAYSADKSLSLTAKGERKAIDALKEQCK